MTSAPLANRAASICIAEFLCEHRETAMSVLGKAGGVGRALVDEAFI